MAKILVIDDDLDLLENMTVLLTAQGHQVITATNVSTAINTLAIDPDIQLVLCDVNLQHESGTTVHKSFLQNYPLPPSRFVFMTGWADPEQIIYIERSNSLLIHKPFTMRALCAHLESALAP